MRKNLLNLFISVIWFSAIAQQTDTIKFNDVIISSSRTPVVYSEAARVVAIITKDEIRNTPIHSVQDLLEYALNVDVRQYGTYGVLADISVRGGSFDQTLILLNGVKFNNPQTGHHNFNLPIDIENIERIEILEGSGSRVFGPNAFSGAINIITSNSNKTFIKSNITAGEHNYAALSVCASLPIKKFKNTISFANKKSDGYTANTDFDITNYFLQSSYQLKKGEVIFQSGLLDKRFGANNFYQTPYSKQYEEVTSLFNNLQAKLGKKIVVTPSIYFNNQLDHYVFNRYNPSYFTNYHSVNFYGAECNISYTSRYGKSAIGLALGNESIKSTRLGEQLANAIPVKNDTLFKYKYSYLRSNYSLFAEHIVFFRKYSFSAGVLANANSNYSMHFYPGFDAAYQLSKEFKLFCSLNKSLRFPTFTDLFYKGPFNIGNPDLKPEEAISIEIGSKYSNKFINGNFSVFRRYATNVIDWVRYNDTLKWEPKNITELLTNGIEIGFSMYPRNKFGVKFPIRYLTFSYCYNITEKQSGIYISKYALDYLIHKSTLTVYQQLYKNFGASWALSYQQRNGSYTDINFVEKKYTPFMLANLRLIYEEKIYAFFIDITNLFNTTYYDLGYIPMPKRCINGGFKMNLDFISKQNSANQK